MASGLLIVPRTHFRGAEAMLMSSAWSLGCSRTSCDGSDVDRTEAASFHPKPFASKAAWLNGKASDYESVIRRLQVRSREFKLRVRASSDSIQCGGRSTRSFLLPARVARQPSLLRPVCEAGVWSIARAKPAGRFACAL